MFVIHETLTKKRKTIKLMQCSITTFPLLSYGSVFFLKRRYYYALVVLKCQKTQFFNSVSFKIFKLLNGPRFNRCTSISFTI